MKTITPTQLNTVDRKWFIVDAKGQTLWRLATTIAQILKWKNKVDFIPHLDNGDYVIVKNCNTFKVTWKKMEDKTYHTHSGYLWGLKSISLEDLLIKKPSQPLKLAVSGMLPKNKLRKWMLSRLKLFTGEEHTFVAQKPEEIKL